MTVLHAAMHGLIDDPGKTFGLHLKRYTVTAASGHWPEKYENDPNYKGSPDDTWSERVSFRAKGEKDGLYVLYSKECSVDLDLWDANASRGGWGEENVYDYMVLVWYPTDTAYNDKAYAEAEGVARTRTGFPWDFQRTYFSEMPGDLTASFWEYLGEWVRAHGKNINFSSVVDWNDDEVARGDGSNLRATIAGCIADPSDWDNDDLSEMAFDLGVGQRGASRKKSLAILKALLQDKETDWQALETKAQVAGWDFSDTGDGEEDSDEEAPGTADQYAALNLDELYHKADELLQRFTGMGDDAEEEAKELRTDLESAYDAKDHGEMVAALEMVQDSFVSYSKDAPVVVDPDDVEALPPGTVIHEADATDPSDNRQPVQSTEHARPDSEAPALNDEKDADPPTKNRGSVPVDPEDRLSDLASRLESKEKGKVLDVYLANDIEITLTRKGRANAKDPKYEVAIGTWFDDDEIEQYLDLMGAERKGKQQTAGFGKKWVRMEKDSDGDWDLYSTRQLSLDEIVEWVSYLARIKTGSEAEEGGGDDPRDFKLFDASDFMDPEAIVPGAGEEDDEEPEDYAYNTLDEWHEALVDQMGLVQTSNVRYTRPGKDGKDIIVKLVEPEAIELQLKKIKQAVLLHGNKKVYTYMNDEDLLNGVRMLLPKDAQDAGGHKAGDVIDSDDEDTGLTVMDDVYIIDWNGVDFIALDGEEADASWLGSHGFVWHPAIWTFEFKSKAKGLKALDRIKASGIVVENEDEVIKQIQGRRVKPKPFMQAMKEMAKERRRRPTDMRFTVHLADGEDGEKLLMLTRRVNNKNADRGLRKWKWEMDSPGYWRPVKGKAEARKVLKALHKDGLRLSDTEGFEERWESTYGGKAPANFEVASGVGKEPKEKASKPSKAKNMPAWLEKRSNREQQLAEAVKAQHGIWPEEWHSAEDMEDLLRE